MRFKPPIKTVYPTKNNSYLYTSYTLRYICFHVKLLEVSSRFLGVHFNMPSRLFLHLTVYRVFTQESVPEMVLQDQDMSYITIV